MKTSLQLILGIAVFGLAFSGWLVFRELLHPVSAGTCTEVGPANTILQQPPCVYGFLMYLGIVIVASTGLFRGRTTTRPPITRPTASASSSAGHT